MTTTENTPQAAGELFAVFATTHDGNVVRVSDPLSWGAAQHDWRDLDELRVAGRFPHVKHFEVRTVWLGPDRPLVGPEVHSHDRYDGAKVDVLYRRPVLARSRGFKSLEQAARAAWRHSMGDRFRVRAGVGRERYSDPAGTMTGVQGRGGWFYYPNGTVAAQGRYDLARVAQQRRMVVAGADGRWYVLENEARS
jgi:hypothetical protein